MPRACLGVVLLVPPPLDREIDTLRRAVGDPDLGRVPSHCTLVPPVNVPSDRVDDAIECLRWVGAASRPFTVELGPPTTFWPDSPVLYLAIAGPGVDALMALRNQVFVDPLDRPLTWPFVPHVTLHPDLTAERINAALLALDGYRTEVTFDRIHLLIQRDDHSWQPLADVALAVPAVIGRGGLPLELSVTERPDPTGRAFLTREGPLADQATFEADLVALAVAGDPVAITARRDGEVVGLAQGSTAGGLGVLERLLVAAAHRDEGVGSALLAAFESLAVRRNCKRLVTQVPVGGRAEAFFRGRGWVEEVHLSPWLYGRDFVQLRRDC